MKELQVGGSVASNRHFYIERRADRELYQALNKHELCYVFNSRQMGKSSLLLHVKSQLVNEGVQCCFIDLSRIGSVDISIEQWYAGIISELWRGFKLPSGNAMLTWWQQHQHLSPAYKFDQFFRELLKQHEQNQLTNYVVFFDEVDSVLSLPFKADDFFAIIRGLFNHRAEDANFKHITFALFGVASPADLIQDNTRSPFNIGRAIKLEGFTLSEAQELSGAFSDYPLVKKQLLSEVIYWTGGQPFLTQKLCRLVLDRLNEDAQQSVPPLSAQNVKSLVKEVVTNRIFNNWESQDNPEHIRSIRDRATLDNVYNAQILADYRDILNAPSQSFAIKELANYNRLYLTGLIALIDGHATPRTRIYHHIFNIDWVEHQLADIRPFHEKLKLWQDSGCIDTQWLLSEYELTTAKCWAHQRQLADIDHRFLNASEHQVTEQVKAWNQKLEQEIEQRKRAEKKLKSMVKAYEQAKQEAEQANSAKTEFLARISHEVRTHLNSITGLGYIAEQQEIDPEKKSNIKKIGRTAKSMLHIMNDMVDINKIESGTLEVHEETFFIDDIVDRVIDTLAYAVADKGLDVEFAMPSEPVNAIISDANRVEQLLTNLIVSSLKRISSGTLGLLVEQQNCGHDQIKLNFTIEDTGKSLPQPSIQHEQFEQAFERYHLDINMKLAYQLACLLGGQLDVLESQEHTGTKVLFSCTFKTTNTQWLKNKLTEPILIERTLLERTSTQFLDQAGYDLTAIDLSDLNINYSQKLLLINEESLYQQKKLFSFIQQYPQITIVPVLNVGHQIPHWFRECGVNTHIEFPCTAKRLYNTLTALIETPHQSVQQFNAHFADINILVAEDDEINQQIIKELLKSFDVNCHVCSNGKEVVEIAQEQPFDLILMDIEMPVMDGVSAVKKLRKLGQQQGKSFLSSIPIIAMTAYALLDDRKKFIAAGMNDYLSKPIEPHHLTNVLNGWIPERNIKMQPAMASDNPLAINYVDTDAGLLRCGNNASLYRELLLQFANNYEQGFNVSNDNFDAKLHTLKGSAANLGINQLAHFISLAEEHEQTPGANPLQVINQIDALIKIISNEIKQQIKTNTDNDANFSQQQAKTLLKQFVSQLDTDHAEAAETIELLPLNEDPTFYDIHQAMQCFDTDKAKSLSLAWLDKQ